MAITAALVKELRERTGAGMMECKKALVASNGDIEAAIKAMRESGQAKADKKAGRITAEGVVVTKRSDDKKSAAIVEINCETDFVAKDENFRNFADAVVECALSNQESEVAKLAALTFSDGQTVEEARKALVAKIGENVQLRRAAAIKSQGAIACYQHGDTIGVLVDVSKAGEALGKDIAMHIAASAPEAISPDDVPEEMIDQEKEIFTAQAKSSGKPPEIIEKMIGGRIKKFLNEVSLLGQPFVKDPSKSIADLLKEHDASVTNFVRYKVGEGIEKEEGDFAAEVMAQVQGS